MTLAAVRNGFQPHLVRKWLTTIHANSRGFIWIGSHHDRFKGQCFDVRNPRWLDAATAYVQQLDRTGTTGIYLRTTTLATRPREGRGGDDDSLTLPGLAADLDIAGPGHKTDKPLPPNPREARRIIDESGLPDPSIWIHSGGGLYAWWLLDVPHTIGADLARIKRLAARWQDPIAHAAETIGYSHGRLGDLARILRIPGTWNRKPAMPQPAPCRILQDTGRRYTLDNLRGCLTDALAAIPAPEPVRLNPRRVVSSGSDLTPWDDYETQTDWADILQPHGWTLHHTTGQVRYWTRPHKNPRDGWSASTGRANDRDRLYCFTDATEFPANQPVTKFHVYAVLEHSGDHTAAARELRRLGYGAQPTSERRAA